MQIKTESKHGISATLDLAGDLYSVLFAEVTERLDEVPVLKVRATRDDALPRPVALLGLEATFDVGKADIAENARTFKGDVTAAMRRVDAEGRPFIELEISPKLFRLTKRAQCRTFLEKKASDILKSVFDDAGVPFELSLGETHEPRLQTVQYRETDFAFVRRLCSEEGIAIAHDHATGKAVLFDDPHGIGDADDATMEYRPEFGFDQGEATVLKISRTHRMTSDKVASRTYDHAKPTLEILGEAESTDPGGHELEVYEWPVRSDTPPTAKRWAQILLDEIQCRRDIVRGATTSLRLAIGQRFKIENHPLEELNEEMLVTAVTLSHHDHRSGVRTDSGEGNDSTRVEFEAIPTGRSSYRPERRPRAEVVHGIQVAVTRGASGQEVDVDSHGQVVAQMPWDRLAKEDEHASTRMRTLQLPTGGSMLLPRVGWEVIVQCEDGDPDIPFVMGRLYNGVNTPPYALPGGAMRSSLQTATTPGGGTSNELRTDDSKGKEEMFFNASKDMSVSVGNNTTESIGNNATLQVGGNRTVDVTNSVTTIVGADQSITVGGNDKNAIESIAVDKCTDYTLVVGGNRDMKVGGDHKFTVAGDSKVDVGSLKVDLVVGKVSETVDGDMTQKVGGADVTITAANTSLEGGGAFTENIGAVNITATKGGVGSEVAGDSTWMAAGARFFKVGGDRSESSDGGLTQLIAGAHMVKADNIVIEADSALALVMGGSIIALTPASISLIGTSIKIDGETLETAAIVMDL